MIIMPQDKESRSKMMEEIADRHSLMLSPECDDIAKYEILWEECSVHIMNVVEDDGELSTLPWLMFELVTYDGEKRLISMRRILPNLDLTDIIEQTVGSAESMSLW